VRIPPGEPKNRERFRLRLESQEPLDMSVGRLPLDGAISSTRVTAGTGSAETWPRAACYFSEAAQKKA